MSIGLNADISNMKLERPKVNVVDVPNCYAKNNKYSYNESKALLDKINNDIYEGTKNEEGNHTFNFKKYFTIFGIVSLLACIISYLRKK